MKNAALILSIFFFGTGLHFNAFANPANDLNRTIILIDGIPFLVDLDVEGGVIEHLAAVPNYFKSPESHEMMVVRISGEYESALVSEMKARLIIFEEDDSILNRHAIDHIRDIATLHAKGFVNEINITAGHAEDSSDEEVTAHRINAIHQLLNDFGVEDENIQADMKIYQSDIPNQFVTISIEKY